MKFLLANCEPTLMADETINTKGLLQPLMYPTSPPLGHFGPKLSNPPTSECVNHRDIFYQKLPFNIYYILSNLKTIKHT